MSYKNPYQHQNVYHSPDPEKLKALKRVLGIILIVGLLAFFGMDCTYSLNENQFGVVNTLGSISVESQSGIHFKIPLLQRVEKVSKQITGMAIGYDASTNQSIDRESLMITSDANFVNVDFYIEYRIVDPAKYLYNSDQPITILRNLAQSYIRDTVGSYEVDDVITTGKAAIQSEVKEKLSNRITSEDLGLMIINVTIQDAEPPTLEVSEAFKAVETAKQGADTAVNNARKYASEKIPAAEAEADQIVKQAEAQKQSRINEASGQVARFNQMYDEYIKYPEVTRQRMFYETMEEILPQLQIIIGEENQIQLWLPQQDSIVTESAGN